MSGAENITSQSNGAAELYISVDLLCGAELHNSVDLLCDTTAADRATPLGKFTLWHNGGRTKPGLMHAPEQESQTFSKNGDEPVTNHAEKYAGLIHSKI